MLMFTPLPLSDVSGPVDLSRYHKSLPSKMRSARLLAVSLTSGTSAIVMLTANRGTYV